MIRKHWKILLITSIVTLLPILVGLILWDKLPQQIPIHWNASGEIDGYSNKPLTVLGIPSILLLIHWVCALSTSAESRQKDHPKKILHLVFWITPTLSIMLLAIVYATALGKDVPVEIFAPVFLGLLFAIIGNYLPKCKQSYTIGIKLPWTLKSEENWRKTHRFAGFLWTIGGVVTMLSGFLGSIFFSLGTVLVIAFLPMIYSYILHRRGI